MDENTKTVLVAILALLAPVISAIIYILLHIRVGPPVAPGSLVGSTPPTTHMVDLTLEAASTKVLLPDPYTIPDNEIKGQ